MVDPNGRHPEPSVRGVARRRIRVRGLVQGVGFRPTVHRLAAERHLAGWVRNDAEGVLAELEGPPEAIDDLLQTLQADPPPLARIDDVAAEPIDPLGETAFRIETSQGGPRTALVSPDMSVCAHCAREIFDPDDRRHRYPFINCTNCGPRYSIQRDIPYDRPNTTMAGFTMCAACQAEYDDPTSRRFHAQPNACPACGPALELRAGDGRPLPDRDPIETARKALLAGRIVAVKGLTGVHLAVDARDADAVTHLRRRKGRDHKPFAVMAASTDAVAAHARVEDASRALLESMERPIVLLPKRPDHGLAKSVAPASVYFGFMLPYAPVHLLLFEGDFPPMVMTSGNLSEEPICRTADEALRRLRGIADLFLLHDRPIETVVDDSVTLVQGGRPLVLRRGRGYAPRPIRLPISAPAPILAVGPELKNAVCLVREDEAFVSQHVGDLKNALAAEAFETTISKLERLLDVRPVVVAHDLHPSYFSTRYAKRRGLRRVNVQHHHAHVASVMAEHGLEGDVLGLAMDGTGYAPDGTVWGGEVLAASPVHFERLGHVAYVPLPGGEAAVRHPVRTAWALALEAFGRSGAERHLVGRLAETTEADRRLWTRMVERNVNSPRAAGLGRLFDGVSAFTGIADANTYEGQAAIELEAAAAGLPLEAVPYTTALDPAPKGTGETGWIIDTLPAVRDVVRDLERGVKPAAVSARFHATVARMLEEAALRAREETGLERIVLSGGCFANARLVGLLAPALEAAGLDVYVHREVPPGDGGVALGQAYVAAARLAGV